MKNEKWAAAVARKYTGVLQLLHSLAMDGKKVKSDLFIEPKGKDSYTDVSKKGRKDVTLGGVGVWGMWSEFLNTEDQMYQAMKQVQEHEELHIFYTGGRSYKAACDAGRAAIYSYIAKQNGLRSTFRNARDVSAVEKWVKDNYDVGDVLNGIISSTACRIANSLEDGRIERIGAGKSATFAKNREYFRGYCQWMRSEDKEVHTWDEIEENPSLHLILITNEILSLSTTQLYSKGFVRNYGSTELLQEVKACIPYILSGYIGRSTRDIIDSTSKICGQLAPLIYEAAQESAKNADMCRQLTSMLQQLLEAIAREDAGEDSHGDSDKEAEEDTERSMNSSCSSSDLGTVTLPDDDYDKLMEKQKEAGCQGTGGLTIQREHPKEDEDGKDGNGNGKEQSDEKNENSEGKNGSSQSSEQSGDGQASGGQATGSQDDASGEETSDGKSQGKGSNDKSDEEKSDENGESEEGQHSKNESKDTSNKRSNPEGTQESFNSSRGASGRTGGHVKQTAKTPEEIEADLEAALETAKEQFKAHATNEGRDLANAQIAKQNAKKLRPVQKTSTSTSLSKKEVKQLMHDDFHERKRVYPVKEELPAVLQHKGDILHKKIEKYFKSLQSPSIRYRTNGTLDKGGIARLAKNKINVFKKNNKNKLRKGCVYILIDNSGSMGNGRGSKRYMADMAAAVVEEGFRGLMPMKIVSFDSDWNGINHELVKDWDEQLEENCCWNWCIHGHGGSGNEDDKDIAIATQELLKRNEEKKMLIVLSDGAPTDTDATHDRIVEARKAGIQVSGIYFEDGDIDPESYYCNSFKEMYERDYVLCNADEIEENLAKILEGFAHSR